VTLAKLRTALRASARPGDAVFLQRFFKTGPGEYAEGDRFLGVRVPAIRKLVRESGALAEDDILALVRSAFHEERLLGLLLWVRRFERGDAAARRAIYRAYWRERGFVNNWDLVDSSAPQIVGGWVLEHPAERTRLVRLARSKNLWDRRIAMLATFALIRAREFSLTEQIAEILLTDEHDLIHKASGWMLREMGLREPQRLRDFLDKHAAKMPRTMLRYAMEKLSPAMRERYLLMRPSKTSRCAA